MVFSRELKDQKQFSSVGIWRLGCGNVRFEVDDVDKVMLEDRSSIIEYVEESFKSKFKCKLS